MVLLKCALSGCASERKELFHVFCPQHWRLLPEDTRKRLWRTHRRQRTDRIAHDQEVAAALKWLHNHSGAAA